MSDYIVTFISDCVGFGTLLFFCQMFFPTSMLRTNYRKNMGLTSAVGLLAILVHTICFRDGNGLPGVVNNLFYVLVWDLAIVATVVIYRSSVVRYLYAFSNALLLRQSCSRIPQMTVRIWNLPQREIQIVLATQLFYILYCIIVYFLIGKRIKKDERYEPSCDYTFAIMGMTAIILPIALLENTLWEKGVVLYAVFCMGETIYCFLAVLLLYMLYRSSMRTAELEAANTILQERHAQETQLRVVMDAMNGKIHDLKHQMHYLETAAEGQSSFMKELREQIASIQSFYQTGNIFLDVLLTEKAMQCQLFQIHFECGIEQGEDYAFLSLQDMNALFGNLLDNAIEYLKTVPETDKRYVLIRSVKQGEMLKLKIENYCDKELEWRKDGTPQTTKLDGRNHGYGTRNIKNIAEAYGGNVIFKTEDTMFKVHILFSGSH